MRRLAAPGDFDAVYAIYMHEVVVPYLGHDPMSREAFSAIYRALLDSRCFYVYEVDGQVMGFYKATRHEGRAAHAVLLGTLAVLPQAHGRGVAETMLRDAIAKFEAMGIKRVELMVEADNPRAIAFYERLGFVVEGRLRAAYKRATDAGYTDEIVMGKLL